MYHKKANNNFKKNEKLVETQHKKVLNLKKVGWKSFNQWKNTKRLLKDM